MTAFQKTVKYLAIALAVLLAVGIISGILGVAGLFGGLFSDGAATEEMKTYSVSADIKSLYIEINAADLYIKEGEAFSVESNLKDLKVTEENGCLKLEQTKKLSGNYNGALLTVYVPEAAEFASVTLKTGAGRLTADKIFAETLDFEFGAGDVTINELSATRRAEIEGGAGKMAVSGGSLNNLDLDMGVGKLEIKSEFKGNCSFDLGIGKSDITVLGSEESYGFSLNKGIGSASVNGKSVSSYEVGIDTADSIEINGGIGAVDVKFEK